GSGLPHQRDRVRPGVDRSDPDRRPVRLHRRESRLRHLSRRSWATPVPPGECVVKQKSSPRNPSRIWPIVLVLAVVALFGVTSVPVASVGSSGVVAAAHVRPGGAPTVANITYKSTVDGLTLSYLPYPPTTFSNATTYPLVVFLHGDGTGTTENITGGVGGVQNPGQLQNNSSNYGYIMISPNTRTTQPYYINTPCGGPQAQDILDAIASEERQNKISGVYLTGFSGGSNGALLLAGHHLIPGLRGVATTGTITDIFEVFNFLNITGSSAHYQGWAAAECSHFLSPQNTTQWRTAQYESVFRFAPQNFTSLQVYIASGERDNTVGNSVTFWPYLQAKSTLITPTSLVSSTLGEPSNTTKSYWNLTGGHNFVDQYNGPAGHTSVQADWAKVFEFWAGRLASGFYIDSASPATNTSWSTLGGLPVSGPPSTPTTPPNVIVPPQTPQFACGSGAGGGSGSGAINKMRGDTLLVMVGLGAQKVNTITDTAGDTFSFLAQAFNVGHS